MLDKIMGFLGTAAGYIGDFLGGLFERIGPPDAWPGWAWAGLAVAGIMGVAAYVWNRTGKGMLIMLTLLAVFVWFVAMGARG